MSGVTLCPTCLEVIHLDQVALWRRAPDGGFPERAGVEAYKRQGGRDIARLKRGFFQGCNDGHELPRDFVKLGSRGLALIGPPRSMKTHFISVVTHQAIAQTKFIDWERSTSLHFEATLETTTLLDNVYWPFMTQGTLLPPTQPASAAPSLVRPPITMLLNRETAAPFRLQRKTIRYMMMFDAPGEPMAGDSAGRIEVAPYIVAASALLFFVDVQQVPAIRDQIDWPCPEELRKSQYPTGLVTSCAQEIREFEELPVGREIRRPAIAVLAKADLLHYATGDLRAIVAPFLDTLESLTPQQNRTLADRIVREYLPGLRNQLDHNFSDVDVLLASATGEPPQDGFVRSHRPWGCDEVFRSALRRGSLVP